MSQRAGPSRHDATSGRPDPRPATPPSANIRLLVSRPPQTLAAAQRIAAEHLVFSDQAHQGLCWVGQIARLGEQPFCDFWWD